MIFTGGISPALWSPIVSNSAFDVPSIDIDVTPLLPFLWEHQGLGEQTLELEVSNGLGEVGITNYTSVNSNWITSANLLGYQHPDVVDSSGALINVDHQNRASAIPIKIPFTHSFQQIVNGVFSAQIVSTLSFKLKGDKTLNTTFSSYSKGEISNIQHYGRDGDSQALVHVGHSSSSFIITNNDEPEVPPKPDCENLKVKHHKEHELPFNTIHTVNTSYSYPLILSTNLKHKEVGNDGDYEIEYDVGIVDVKELQMNFDGKFGHIEVKQKQNGTSTFVLSGKGNHGFGSLTAKFKEEFEFGSFKKGLTRRVDAINGTIVHEGIHIGPDALKHANGAKYGKHGKHIKHSKHAKHVGGKHADIKKHHQKSILDSIYDIANLKSCHPRGTKPNPVGELIATYKQSGFKDKLGGMTDQVISTLVKYKHMGLDYVAEKKKDFEHHENKHGQK